MKKILFVAAIVFLATSAMAQTPVQPVGVYEVEIWVLDENGVYQNTPGLIGTNDQLARAFASNEATGACNKKYWHIPVTVHASVAQWIDFTFTGTRWDWFVRKPGWYAANCITAKVASNGDVLIDYEGFGNLQGTFNQIPIWYSFGGSITEAQTNGWVPGPLLNDDDDLLDESEYWLDGRNLLHEGLTWKLFNRINVVDCNTACEYEDVAEIILSLNQQKIWIEQSETAPNYGFFVDPFYGPNGN